MRAADPHLRSTVEVTGYRVHALDGEIGHIENRVIDEADWSVHYLIVDTRNWWFGKHALISPIACFSALSSTSGSGVSLRKCERTR